MERSSCEQRFKPGGAQLFSVLQAEAEPSRSMACGQQRVHNQQSLGGSNEVKWAQKRG